MAVWWSQKKAENFFACVSVVIVTAVVVVVAVLATDVVGDGGSVVMVWVVVVEVMVVSAAKTQPSSCCFRSCGARNSCAGKRVLVYACTKGLTLPLLGLQGLQHLQKRAPNCSKDFISERRTICLGESLVSRRLCS